ncbi:MAG: leucine-rich repeat domain-containing protein, partial [Bacteroidaceae bacterium]|nr:leucine-rich repeat domain-containing protein [Bacteroidaceae bacterium]
ADDGFCYYLDTETLEATLGGYRGDATEVVISEFVTYEGEDYKVTSLGDFCFDGCSSLVTVELPSSVVSLGGYCFDGCSSLTTIEIPSSVVSLGERCFRGCSSLPSIVIPSSVTSLGTSCFYDCSSLPAIEIPSSVTSVGHWCFYGCSSLKTVIWKMDKRIEDGSLFELVPTNVATLYVPKEMLELYNPPKKKDAKDPWRSFGTILPWTDELEVSVDETSEFNIALKTYNGNVVVSGLTDGTPVSCYTIDGRMLGFTSADGGTASFVAEPNSIVIVRAGRQTFKVYVK